jgi:uncharacterized protein (TIGR04255 family)
MSKKEVDFSSPPVNEVVFGFVFERPTRLLSAHIGAFWSRIRENFPTSADQPPLFSVGDVIDPSAHLTRVWFVSKDGHRLIQLQHDRLYYNWRRQEGGASEYPEYASLFSDFSNVVQEFLSFLKDEGFTDDLRASQFELSYINLLERPQGWAPDAPLGNLLVDHKRSKSPSRFLPQPRDYAWVSVFEMPRQTGQLVVEAKSGAKTENPEQRVIQLTLTAKSGELQPESNTVGTGSGWYDSAHQQIVKGFVDITDPEVQRKEWGKR